MRHRRRLFSLLAGVVLVGALPGIAAANTTNADDTGGLTLTLPGVPLAFEVTLDADGNIHIVSVAPGFDQVDSSDHEVTFERTGDGTVVEVKAEGEKLTAKVKTSTLADLVGENVWTGYIFGTDKTTTVTFGIGWGDSGKTYLVIADDPAISVVSPYSSTISDPYTEDDDDDEYESKVTIVFLDADGNTMTLTIEVETEYGDDDEEHDGVYAKLKITLRGDDHQEITDAIVPREPWNGTLCDGTTQASVAYTVDAANGTITVDSVTPSTAKVEPDGHGFEVEFKTATGEDNGELEVELESEHGITELKVEFSCDEDDEDADHSTLSDDDDDDDDHSTLSDDDEDGDHSSSSVNDEDDDDSEDD